MAGKPKRRRSFVALALAAVLFAGAVATRFAAPDGASELLGQWLTRNEVSDPFYGTDLRLQTERTRIDVYDTRRSPALIRSLTVKGHHFVTLKYIKPVGKPFDVFELRSGNDSETGDTLLRLPVDPTAETLVDARWQNLYEVESGSQLNAHYGSFVRCQRGGLSYQSSDDSPSWMASGLVPEPAAPLPNPASQIRVIIRPDMTSPLWGWERQTAMRGGNSRYYLSSYHPSGIPAKELAAAIIRNPPRD